MWLKVFFMLVQKRAPLSYDLLKNFRLQWFTHMNKKLDARKKKFKMQTNILNNGYFIRVFKTDKMRSSLKNVNRVWNNMTKVNIYKLWK